MVRDDRATRRVTRTEPGGGARVYFVYLAITAATVSRASFILLTGMLAFAARSALPALTAYARMARAVALAVQQGLVLTVVRVVALHLMIPAQQ